MLNPYLSKRTSNKGTTFRAELKRLLDSPLRVAATFLFIVLPALVLGMGATDFAIGGVYSLTHHMRPDERPVVAVWNCLAGEHFTNECARAQLSYKSSVRLLLLGFVPPHPAIYLSPLILAFIAFVSIGNPRIAQLGTTLKRVLGLKGGASIREEDAEVAPGSIPPRLDIWEENWFIGRLVSRNWFSDPGYFDYEYNRKFIPYFLNTDMLRTNLMIVAPPGSGKTFSIYYPFIHYARANGVAALFFDSKGEDFESSLFDLNFDLNHPERSFKINLFTGPTPAKAGERLGEALIPELSEERKYFSDVAKDAMSALVSAHVAVSKGVYPELSTLLLYLSQMEKLKSLRGEVARSVLDEEGDLTVEGHLICAGLDRIKQLVGTKNDALGSLITALTPLTTPEIAKLLVANPATQAHFTIAKTMVYTIEELLRRPLLARFSLPVAGSRVAPIIGRLVLNQFNSAVLDPGCNTQIFKVACVDEAHNFISNSIARGMVQARSNNAGFMLAFQTLSQIPDERMLETIFAASGIKVVMAGVGDKDADRFSRTFGDLELEYVSHSESRSKSQGGSQGNSTSRVSAFEFESNGTSEQGRSQRTTRSNNHNQSAQRGESTNLQLKARRQFLPSEIRGLKKYHAIIESSDATGSRFASQVIDMTNTVIAGMETTLRPPEPSKRAPKAKGRKVAPAGKGVKSSYIFSWGEAIERPNTSQKQPGNSQSSHLVITSSELSTVSQEVKTSHAKVTDWQPITLTHNTSYTAPPAPSWLARSGPVIQNDQDKEEAEDNAKG